MTDQTLLQQYLADHDIDNDDAEPQDLSHYVSGILSTFQVGDIGSDEVDRQVTELVEHVADGVEEATGLREPVWMVRYHLDFVFGDRQGRDNHREALLFACDMIQAGREYRDITDKETRPS